MGILLYLTGIIVSLVVIHYYNKIVEQEEYKIPFKWALLMSLVTSWVAAIVYLCFILAELFSNTKHFPHLYELYYKWDKKFQCE